MILRQVKDYYRQLDHHLREVMRGTIIALVLKVLGAGLSLGSNVLLTRLLGADGAGTYFLCLAIVTIASVIARMGLDNTLLRFIAANASIKDWQAVAGVYNKGTAIVLLTSCAATAVVFAIAPWLAESVFSKPGLSTPLRWMALALVPTALLNLHAEALKGLRRILESQVIQAVSVSALLGVGLLMLRPSPSVRGAVLVHVVASALTMIAGFVLWRWVTGPLQLAQGKFPTQRLLNSSMPLFLVSAMNILMTRTPTFVLGIWGSNADVGIFGVASRTALALSYILIAVNNVVAPKFAALHRKGDREALTSTVRNATKLTALLASPFLLLFLAAPGWIMGLFGPEFSDQGAVLVVLAMGQVVNILTGLTRYLLMMCGRERVVGLSFVAVAIMNGILSVALIPWLGVLGAAIATAATVVINNLGLAYHVWSRLGISVIPLCGCLKDATSRG